MGTFVKLVPLNTNYNIFAKTRENKGPEEQLILFLRLKTLLQMTN